MAQMEHTLLIWWLREYEGDTRPIKMNASEQVTSPLSFVENTNITQR